MAKGEITAQEGSFPLTRGKRGLVQILSSPRRLIPAHAGKTMPPTASLEAHRAHPRSRGENVGDFASGPGGQGSSPLTRGKRANAHRGFLTVRLIPAHAGKTVCGFSPASPAPAHPRSRGENFVVVEELPDGVGSSPLTRGKQRLRLSLLSPPRLIPAHAGKTVCDRAYKHHGPAHPRSRGENVLPRLPSADFAGSSPLTRGKPCFRRSGRQRGRLIPAHAGKTCRSRARPWTRRAHPRSRGENRLSIGAGDRRAGSSPLTRGKRALRSVKGLQGRLIPAHAGKTTLNGAFCYAPQAHPRSRGENGVSPPVRSSPIGSSPLTRGKPQQAALAVHALRLIPAHAGKTSRPP